MGSIRKACAALVLALLCWPSGASTPSADPEVWGVYAQLVGTQWTGRPGSGRGTDRWRWGEGEEAGSIVESGEEWGGRYIIRPGPDPGTLSKDFSRGVHHFRGTIAPDGSVLWIRKGMIKSPHRISLVDGELREESGLELQGDQVVAAKHVAHYEQSGGAPVAGAAAAAARTSAETSVVADRVDTPATTHGDPAQALADATTAPANLPSAGAQELEAAAATLLARAAQQRETEAQVQRQVRLTEARAAQREAEAAADAAEQALAKAVAARAALEAVPADARKKQPAKKRTTPPVYVYCTANSGPTLLFSNVFTINREGMVASVQVDAATTEPEVAWNNDDDDLFGQFVAMAESQGIKKRHTGCYVAASMDQMRKHYARKDYYLSYLPVDWSRFGNWRPTGDFVIAAESWGGVDSKNNHSAAATPPVPTAEAVVALERTAIKARTRADTASQAVEQLASKPPQQCRDVPRVVNELSGFHASRQEAELRAREVAGRACGAQGVAGGIKLSCRAHDTSLDVDIGNKGQVISRPDSPDKWVCNAEATCVQPRKVCEPRSTEKGSSAQ